MSDFTAVPATTPAAPAASTVPPAAPATDTVVLEYAGRKFTQADLLQKLEHADKHIQTLTEEREADRKLLAEVAPALQNQVQITDLLKALKNPAAPAEATTPSASVQSLTANDVVSILDQRKAAEVEAANFQSVVGKLTEAFGDKVNDKVREIATANGTTVEAIQRLAHQSPALVLNLFPDLNKTPLTPAIPGSTVRHDGSIAPAGPTGYLKAKNDRERIAIYNAKLAALSNQQ